jgi:ABC-type sulfate/molybdate transport systems ATPase subunit
MLADSQENTFPCWLVSTSEAPHEMTVYLRLHAAPLEGEPAHLQADVPKDYWRTLSAQPQPWRVQLHPERLLLLNGESAATRCKSRLNSRI